MNIISIVPCSRLFLTFLLLAGRLDGGTLLDLTPTDQAPVFLNPSAESDLVSLLRADGTGQDNLCKVILLDSKNSTTSCCGTDVDHDDFSLHQLGNLACLGVTLNLDTKQTAEQVVLDFDLNIDLWQTTRTAKNLSEQAIRTSERRINLCSNTDETTWHGELKSVLFCSQRDNAGLDWLAN